MESKIRLATLLMLLLSFASCATVGRHFQFMGTESIQIGKTTRADIFKTYGEPFRVGYDNGNVKWTYGYYLYRVIGTTETKDLIITFDANGVVKDYTYSTSMKDEKSAILHEKP
ncbi:MAG: outer membrane protein assembly factor BamE [Bdellovibrio sp.]|nr:outer membrane protein assembly factor BamE [Bdellovibrio sp.]